MRGRIGAPLFSGAVRIEPQINARRAGGRGPQFAVSVKEGSVSDHINYTDRDVIAKFTWRNNAPVSWDDDDSTTTMRWRCAREGGGLL